MSFQPRHIAAALAAAFIVGTVGGGVLLAGDGGSTPGTGVPFDPGADDVSAEVSESPSPKASGGFTAQADNEGGRVVITGEGAEPGAELVVQRKESGGWQDFPAHATAAKDGSYSTYIITSRDGTYRLKDTGSDAASDPVKVTAPARTDFKPKTDDKAKDKTTDKPKA